MSSRAEEKERRREERLAAEQAAKQQASRKKRLIQLGSVLAAAAAILVVFIVISQSGSNDAGETDSSGVTGAAEVTAMLKGVPQKGVTLGNPDAPVTLVEYADLQCPFCRDYSLNVLPELIEKYVKPGKVKLELRLLRFLGDDSDRAGRAALVAAEENRFWNYTDLFYRNQGEEGAGYADDDFLGRLANATPGLTADEVLSKSTNQSYEDQMGQFESGAQTLGIDSTPSFLLGKSGQALGADDKLEPRTLTPGEFTGPIDEALAEG